MRETLFILMLSAWLSAPGVGCADEEKPAKPDAAPASSSESPEAEPPDIEADAIGHWEGHIVGTPGQKLAVAVDLNRVAEKTWKGHLDLSGRSIYDLPLKNVRVSGKEVRFELTVLPSEPTVQAELGEDGKTMKGEYTQAGQSFRIRLERTSTEPEEAKGLDPEIVSWIGDGVAGQGIVAVWRGAIALGSNALRLELDIRRTEDGTLLGDFREHRSGERPRRGHSHRFRREDPEFRGTQCQRALRRAHA